MSTASEQSSEAQRCTSSARWPGGEARPDSDIDVLVEFAGPPTFAQFMDLKALLEDTLGAHVDLVTRAALRPQLQPRIVAEARRVA